MNLPLLAVLSQGQEKPSCFSNPDFFSCSYGHYYLPGAQVQSSFAFLSEIEHLRLVTCLVRNACQLPKCKTVLPA